VFPVRYETNFFTLSRVRVLRRKLIVGFEFDQDLFEFEKL
jgi:hypothetical protein